MFGGTRNVLQEHYVWKDKIRKRIIRLALARESSQSAATESNSITKPEGGHPINKASISHSTSIGTWCLYSTIIHNSAPRNFYRAAPRLEPVLRIVLVAIHGGPAKKNVSPSHKQYKLSHSSSANHTRPVLFIPGGSSYFLPFLFRRSFVLLAKDVFAGTHL